MSPYDYKQFTNQLRKELFLREIHFIQGNNGTFVIKSITKPEDEYIIFINDKGLCFVSKGSEQKGFIDLIRKDKKITYQGIGYDTLMYNQFLKNLDNDKALAEKYGFSQIMVIDLAVILCFDVPKFIFIKE